MTTVSIASWGTKLSKSIGMAIDRAGQENENANSSHPKLPLGDDCSSYSYTAVGGNQYKI